MGCLVLLIVFCTFVTHDKLLDIVRKEDNMIMLAADESLAGIAPNRGLASADIAFAVLMLY
jgi:hypothetical protein